MAVKRRRKRQPAPVEKQITRTAEGGKWLMFWCPGCGNAHCVAIAPERNSRGAQWTWNGSRDKPTLDPSILAQGEAYCCHSYVEKGEIRYLPDCTHKFAGQTLPLQPF